METKTDEHGEGSTQNQQIPPAPATKPARPGNHPNTGSEQKQEEEIKALSKRVDYGLWFSGVVAFVAVISVGVSIVQWRAMREQSDTMKRQLDEARKGVQKQIRPYLLSDVVFEPISLGKPARVKHNVINYGQSPALKARIFASAFIGPDAMKRVDKWLANPENSVTETTGGPIIPPGTPAADTKGKFFHVETDRRVTRRDLEQVKNNPNWIVSISRYVYADSFGDSYGTQNCFRMASDGSAEDCPGYNGMFGPDWGPSKKPE